MSNEMQSDEMIEKEQEILDNLIDEVEAEISWLNDKSERKELNVKRQRNQDNPDAYGAFLDARSSKEAIDRRIGDAKRGRKDLYEVRVVLREDGKNEIEAKAGLHELHAHGGKLLIQTWKDPVCRLFWSDNSLLKNDVNVNGI
ncbi:MAG: hypothetical protein LUI02_01975 [Clostridiales bacterium]|nr:hypothetical protein [Clostridiales bacterium]